MIREFAKNSFIYGIGTVLTRGIGVILVPVYTRYLSPGEYGVIDLFMVIASIVNIVITLEITQGVARLYQDAGNDQDKIEYTSTSFLFTIGVYFLFLLVSIYASSELAVVILGDIHHENIVLLGSVSIATGGLFIFAQNQLKWQIKPKNSAISSLVNVLTIAVVAIYLLVVEEMKIESIFIGQIVGNITGTLVSMYSVKESYRLYFVFDKLKEMLHFSFPLVFSSIAVFVALFIDRIAIKDLIGIEALGIYGIAYRFAAVAGLVMIGFQSSLTPLVYKHYKDATTPKKIAEIFNIFLVFALFVVAGAFVFSREVVVLMSTEEYYNASILIGPLVLAVFFSGMYIFSPGLGLAKKTRTMALISIIIAVVNTILNYTIIPVMGVMGAALSTLLSAIIAYVLYVVLGNKYYLIPNNWGRILSVSFLVMMSGLLIEEVLYEISFFNIFLKAIYLSIVFVILMYALISSYHRGKIFSFFRTLKA